MQHGSQFTTGPSGKVKSRPLAASFTTLAELLSESGYRTGAVVAGPVLARELGLAQGFETYEDALDTPERRHHGQRAQQVADEAIALVQRFGEMPYFIFVNFFDPHTPYEPPPPFNRDLPPKIDLNAVKKLLKQLDAGRRAGTPRELEADQRRLLSAAAVAYDAEIRYMDHHLGRLLDAIRGTARGGQTLIIITGDHGESFGEHYQVLHGAHLYEHNVRVPLLVRRPGKGGAERVARPAQNHRVFGLILRAAGLEVPSSVGVHELAALDAPPVMELKKNPTIVGLLGDFFARDLRAIYVPPYKLIASSTGVIELFNVDLDPHELRDLMPMERERARRLERQLASIVAERPLLFVEEGQPEFRPETEQALRALGYVD
jgi:arylsulfatase A-like enzyme